MALRADALGNANLSKAAYVQPPVIVQVATLDNSQLPVPGPCPSPPPSPCKALVYVCYRFDGSHGASISVVGR